MTRMKTTQQIYDRERRLFAAVMGRARRRARAAHPETAGNQLLVHNWGNEAAKDAYAQAEALWARLVPASKRAYALAEHARHGDTLRPLWCRHCNAEP